MSLSENIKRLRHEKNMTQEQLAAKLGVSPQAISKWETSETYPDGSLLVTLANELGVSLDTLFDNEAVGMADVSERIIKLLNNADASERFDIARDIGWQIERGLFYSGTEIDLKYDSDEIKNQINASYILNDFGFTVISNGAEPFFSVFPEPAEGFGAFLNDSETLHNVFTALADENTMKVLIHLYHKSENYFFEPAVPENECGIASDCMDMVLKNLIFLKVIRKQSIAINGEMRTLYCSCQNHKLIALFLMAKEAVCSGNYSLQSHRRNTPFFR